MSSEKEKSTQFELAHPPTDAISSLHFAPGNSTLLLATSWDRHVYLYDVALPAEQQFLGKSEHRAPVLDACFGPDNDTAFSACLDWGVYQIHLPTGALTLLSTHGAGVRSVAYSTSPPLLISASWDSTLHIHSLTSAQPTITTLALPHKPFSLSLSPDKLVVAMAARALHIYSLASLLSPPASPIQERESSLKFMTRAVACMPNGAGYASSSIEGRVAVEWFDASPESQARKYAFKCHRQAGDGADVVYPVNALAFHPVHGTFASGGGDGVVALWDGVAKRRIRQYQRYPASVAALAFSGEGRYLAVACCRGFEDGMEQERGEVDADARVYVRVLGEGEAKGKGPK
ncbi:MAG: hypothetical protein M1829_003143 [Trizodia sp. TS-e1964]|nr:MAG: hypothetical protein M1829_003143 [Trizodia sp. TS-e1964]